MGNSGQLWETMGNSGPLRGHIFWSTLRLVLVFRNSEQIVVQEQCVLRVSLTGGAFEKDDFSNIPERSINGHSGTICFGCFNYRIRVRGRCFCVCVPEQCMNSRSSTMCFEGFINKRCIRKRCF